MQDVNYRKIDWVILGIWLGLMLFGWMNIYS